MCPGGSIRPLLNPLLNKLGVKRNVFSIIWLTVCCHYFIAGETGPAYGNTHVTDGYIHDSTLILSSSVVIYIAVMCRVYSYLPNSHKRKTDARTLQQILGHPLVSIIKNTDAGGGATQHNRLSRVLPWLKALSLCSVKLQIWLSFTAAFLAFYTRGGYVCYSVTFYALFNSFDVPFGHSWFVDLCRFIVGFTLESAVIVYLLAQLPFTRQLLIEAIGMDSYVIYVGQNPGSDLFKRGMMSASITATVAAFMGIGASLLHKAGTDQLNSQHANAYIESMKKAGIPPDPATIAKLYTKPEPTLISKELVEIAKKLIEVKDD